MGAESQGHTEWVSCVRFSPSQSVPLIVSCGWDKLVKVWNLTNCKLRNDLVGHTGYLNTVCVSPDGSWLHLEVRTTPPCYGILTKARGFTAWMPVTSSTDLYSVQTDTGCAQPPKIPSRFGIWSPRL